MQERGAGMRTKLAVLIIKGKSFIPGLDQGVSLAIDDHGFLFFFSLSSFFSAVMSRWN